MSGMFPVSRTTNAQQHAQRTQLPSIIRTRSQQQNPLSPVDLSASPMKAAIRNHIHKPPIEDRDIDSAVDEMHSHQKRPSSPSFAANDHAGKRVRVLAQSTNQNSLGRRHSEESIGTPRKESAHSPANGTYALKRAVSSGSPGKGIVHLDLTKVPQSPSKPPGSPSKMFRITVNGGQMMKVPVTPKKKIANDRTEEPQTPGAFTKVHHTLSEFKVHVDEQPHIPTILTPSRRQSTPTQQPLPNHSQGPLLDQAAHDPNNNGKHMLSSNSFQFKSTPARSRHLGDGSFFFGSPLTPLPPTPNPGGNTLPRRPAFPPRASDGGLKPVDSHLLATEGQISPAKSRIPVPTSTSTSRLPRPSTSTFVATDGPSSTAKSPHHRPMKQKSRINRKPKAEARSRAPITRLAAKRGIVRTSSSITGLRPGASSSTGVNLSLPRTGNADPSDTHKAIGAASEIDRKKSLGTSSRSTDSVTISRAPFSHPHSTSPLKPTPLSALSTALQKLLVTPPAAPVHRPRPNTSLGFAGPSHAPAQTPVLESARGKDDAGVGLKTPGKIPGRTPQADAGMQRAQTSLGHSQPHGTPKGLGRMGLPVRRPGTVAGTGASAAAIGAPFASKRTSLSTVPASPARSAAVPPESDMPSKPQAMQAEVLDVDAWAPSASGDNGKGKAKQDIANLEYTIPLSDESHTATRQPPPEMISPSRRASQASLSLTQSLSLPRAPSVGRPAIVRSASTSTAVPYNPRTPVKTRGRTKPAPPKPEATTNTKQNDPMGGKRSNARMPGSLDVLKDCVIFVDVRTEEGEDAGALFIDMLRGLGARILAKPGKSCTHLVYKDGSPVTLTKYKLLPEPRPLPISIGWVVECVEKREHVDETKFLVNLDEIGVAGGAHRRRSMQPKQMRTMTLGQLDSGQLADISVRADSSFTSEEPSTSGLVLAALSPPVRNPDDNLPPLERARQRSLHLSRR